MAAKDYKICCALFNAYIAKTHKNDPGIMTDDRREIPEEEILQLIHWWLLKKVEESDTDTQYITAGGEKIIELKLLKKE